MRGFETPRTLDLVAAEDFGVGHHHEPGFVGHEPTGEGAEVNRRTDVLPVSIFVFLCGNRWRQAGRLSCVKAELVPNFLKALLLAVVVAEDVDGIILAYPAVKLREEFAALDFRNLGLRSALGDTGT